MSAIVPKIGPLRQIDAPVEPDEQITEADVADAPKLVKLLMRMLRDLATLKRRWWPRYVDFEDVAVDNTGATKYRFPHGFSGRVRWWVVDWITDEASSPMLHRTATSDATDANTLVLVSEVTGTVSIRVEEAG